jgi:hypothetical protein
VNWKNDMVITASNGSKPTAGYNMQITGVQRVGADVIVRVRETRPAADVITAQVVTYPSDAVAVRRLTGNIQFVITTDAPEPPGMPKPAPTPTDAGTNAPTSTNLAKSIFTIQQFGGVAGLNRQTIVHLFGRPLQPGEIPAGVKDMVDAQVAAPTLRLLETSVRESGFLDLNDRYAPEKSFPDQMTRVIRVQMGNVNKTVTVLDGVEPVPPAFTSVWNALQDAIRTTTKS